MMIRGIFLCYIYTVLCVFIHRIHLIKIKNLLKNWSNKRIIELVKELIKRME